MVRLVETGINLLRVKKEFYKTKPKAEEVAKRIIQKFKGEKIIGSSYEDENFYYFKVNDKSKFRIATLNWLMVEKGIEVYKGYLIERNMENYSPQLCNGKKFE